MAVLQLLRGQGLCLVPEGEAGRLGEGVYDAGVAQAGLDAVVGAAASGGHTAVLDWLLELVEGSRVGQQGQPAHVLLKSSLLKQGLAAAVLGWSGGCMSTAARGTGACC